MIRAVLFDRDGTLIADRKDALVLMPGAAAAVSRLRAQRIRLGVVTNQPHAGDAAAYRAMRALHQRIEARIGALDGWFVCTHAPSAGCDCRKPKPGLVHSALAAFGIDAHECVLVGDIGSDIEAARRAGIRAIMVPTPLTRREEIEAAPAVCANLLEAAELISGGHAAA